MFFYLQIRLENIQNTDFQTWLPTGIICGIVKKKNTDYTPSDSDLVGLGHGLGIIIFESNLVNYNL